MAMKFNDSDNVYFTSDTHFSHNQDFIYKNRGCNSIEEHDEMLVERWNETVGIHDIVVHLGDFYFGDVSKVISHIQRLNGKILWIIGNYDTTNKIAAIVEKCKNITALEYATLIQYKKFNFYCSHYPTLTANYDDKHFSQHVISLHGHTHQAKNYLFVDNPFIYHVGVDSHDCYPVHIETILADIRNHWNELGQLHISPTGVYNKYPEGEEIYDPIYSIR